MLELDEVLPLGELDVLPLGDVDDAPPDDVVVSVERDEEPLEVVPGEADGAGAVWRAADAVGFRAIARDDHPACQREGAEAR